MLTALYTDSEIKLLQFAFELTVFNEMKRMGNEIENQY
jgi:hypothetical protein